VTLSPEQARTFLQALRGRRLEVLYLVAITTGMREGSDSGCAGATWTSPRAASASASPAHATGAPAAKPRPLSRGGRSSSPSWPCGRWLPTKRATRPSGSAGGRSGTTSIWCSPTPSGGPSPRRTSCAGPLPAAGGCRAATGPLPRPAAYAGHAAARPRVHPKVVSEMLGHTDVGITLDLYSHVTATMQHDAARNLDALFGGQLWWSDRQRRRRSRRPALVAQGIEQRFPKPCVAGSNPAGGTTSDQLFHHLDPSIIGCPW
jgi:hypothetical protein